MVALGAAWTGLLAELEACVLRGDYAGALLVLQEYLIEHALAHTHDRRMVGVAAKLLHRSKGQYRIQELRPTTAASSTGACSAPVSSSTASPRSSRTGPA